MPSGRSTSSAMENNKDADLNQWITERLNTLDPGSEFRPNEASALARFRRLRDTRFRRTRTWGWTAAAISATLLCVLALPATRSATRHWLNFGDADLNQGVATSDRPVYAGSQLVRPADYR